MAPPLASPARVIRDLESIADLQSVLRMERQVWGFEDADVTPLALAVAMKAAGSVWLGAFEGDTLIGFAFAFPSLEQAHLGLHSHTLAVRPEYTSQGVGYRLKLAQRERALARGISEITWTFDPLRSRNAHLNFAKLGVICKSYRPDFYGDRTSSALHTNGTDRLWVSWKLDSSRVQNRLAGKNSRLEMLDALALLPPLVSFTGDGQPTESDLNEALSRQRIAIEIPGDISSIEANDIVLAREWRNITGRAFTAALAAGFVVTEFCRSIRGQQGPGAYLLEKEAT